MNLFIIRYIIASFLLSLAFSTGAYNDAPLHRNGLMLVEVTATTITEDEGGGRLSGYDAKGWYSAFDAADGYELNDRALSVYIYNPASSHIDDILYRFDWQIAEK